LFRECAESVGQTVNEALIDSVIEYIESVRPGYRYDSNIGMLSQNTTALDYERSAYVSFDQPSEIGRHSEIKYTERHQASSDFWTVNVVDESVGYVSELISGLLSDVVDELYSMMPHQSEPELEYISLVTEGQLEPDPSRNMSCAAFSLFDTESGSWICPLLLLCAELNLSKVLSQNSGDITMQLLNPKKRDLILQSTLQETLETIDGLSTFFSITREKLASSNFTIGSKGVDSSSSLTTPLQNVMSLSCITWATNLAASQGRIFKNKRDLGIWVNDISGTRISDIVDVSVEHDRGKLNVGLPLAESEVDHAKLRQLSVNLKAVDSFAPSHSRL